MKIRLTQNRAVWLIRAIQELLIRENSRNNNNRHRRLPHLQNIVDAFGQEEVEDSQDARDGESDEAVAKRLIVRSGDGEGAAISTETVGVELDGGLGMQRIRTFETLPAKYFRGI